MGILFVFQLLVFLSNLSMFLVSTLLYMPRWHSTAIPVPIALAETPPKAPLTEPFLMSDPAKIPQISLLDKL